MDVSHYITLQNERESEYDINNKLESFNTKLPRKFKLDGEWEAALTEISFVKSWYNFPKDQYFELLVFNKDKPNYLDVITNPEAVFKQGWWNIEEIRDHFNEKIEKFYDSNNKLIGYESKGCLIQYPHFRIEQKVSHNVCYANINLGKLDSQEFVFIRFSDILGRMIGHQTQSITLDAIKTFNQYKEYIDNSEAIPNNADTPKRNGDYLTNLESNDIQNLYITSNLIQNSIYGNRNTNLLRIIDIPKDLKYNDRYIKRFNNLQYWPIRSDLFEEIKIEIFDSLLDHKPVFNYGNIFLNIHLRRVVSSFLFENITRQLDVTTDENIVFPPSAHVSNPQVTPHAEEEIRRPLRDYGLDLPIKRSSD